MATGAKAERKILGFAADLCFLGACGLWPQFGLSAETAGEAGLKRAMAHAATRAIVVTHAAKFDRRGRYRVLLSQDIDTLDTDADATVTSPFVDEGVEVIHV